MSSSVFDWRRAERLAQLLDEAGGGARRRPPATPDRELAGYVRLSHHLRGAANLLPGPSAEFRADLRARLVATAQRGEAEDAVVDDDPGLGSGRVEPRSPSATGRPGRVAVLVGLAGTLAVSGTFAASSGAVPGDPLYGLKRSTENARLALAGSDISRGELYLEFARHRLTEVRTTGTALSGPFDDMDNETRSGVRLLLRAALHRHDGATLYPVDDFVDAQRARLVRLGDSARVLQSITLLDRIAARSATLRANLARGTDNSRADDLGPLPPVCPPTGPVRQWSSGRRTPSTA